MKKYLNIENIKAVPITEIMSYCGFTPRQEHGNDAWYISPWRDEHSASMHVQKRQNRYTDFGEEDKGHSNIDLVIKLGIAPDFYGAALWIKETFCGDVSAPAVRKGRFVSTMRPANAIEKKMHMNVHPIHDKELLKYYEAERCIPFSIVRLYCKEVTYMRKDGIVHNSIGIPNNSGGYAVRTRDFKGDVGPYDISIIHNKGASCAVFEGFMDFLSYVVLHGTADWDIIILNSVIRLPRALPYIQKYKTVFCFMDNDPKGEEATDAIIRACRGRVVDCSGEYAGYKDVNDYLKAINEYV